MQMVRFTFARRRHELGIPIGLPNRTLKRLADDLALIIEDRLRIRNRHLHLKVAATQANRLVGDRKQRGGVTQKVCNPMIAQRVQITGNQTRREMVRGHVELVQTGVPDPERRAPICGRPDELSSEDCPSVVARDAVPLTRTRLEERVPMLNRLATPPKLERCPGCPARVLGKQSASLTVLVDKSCRIR